MRRWSAYWEIMAEGVSYDCDRGECFACGGRRRGSCVGCGLTFCSRDCATCERHREGCAFRNDLGWELYRASWKREVAPYRKGMGSYHRGGDKLLPVLSVLANHGGLDVEWVGVEDDSGSRIDASMALVQGILTATLAASVAHRGRLYLMRHPSVFEAVLRHHSRAAAAVQEVSFLMIRDGCGLLVYDAKPVSMVVTALHLRISCLCYFCQERIATYRTMVGSGYCLKCNVLICPQCVFAVGVDQASCPMFECESSLYAVGGSLQDYAEKLEGEWE